jgi:hypothetical protein
MQHNLSDSKPSVGRDVGSLTPNSCPGKLQLVLVKDQAAVGARVE